MIVTLTPNPSLDRTLFLDTFTRGAVNRCTATLVEPSGKGINVALALHSHGVDGIPVHVTAADPNVTLSEPASP